jgi:hypothetical protein
MKAVKAKRELDPDICSMIPSADSKKRTVVGLFPGCPRGSCFHQCADLELRKSQNEILRGDAPCLVEAWN